MKEKSRSLRLIGEGFWVALGQLLTVIGSLVQVRVLTELVEPAEYGELQIALTISGLVTSTLMAAVNPGITRYYSISTEKGNTSEYLEAAKKLVAYASFAVLLVSFTFSIILVFLDLAHWILLSVIAFGVGLFSSYAGTIGSIQNAARQRILVATHNVANAWIKILFAVLFIYLVAAKSISIAIGFLLTAILVTISQVYFLKKLPRGQLGGNTLSISEDWDSLILKFSRPFLIWGVFGWLQQSSSKWALGLFSTTEEVGLFTALFQIGYAPVAMLSGLLMTFATPIIYSRVGDATDTDRVKEAIKILFLLSLISFALLCSVVLISEFLKEIIFDLAVGEKYKIGSMYLPFMVLAGGLFAIGLIVASIPAALNIPSKLLMPSIISSLVGVAGAFIGAYYYSFEGVVYGLLIHSVSYLLLCCWSVLKIIRDDSKLSIV